MVGKSHFTMVGGVVNWSLYFNWYVMEMIISWITFKVTYNPEYKINQAYVVGSHDVDKLGEVVDQVEKDFDVQVIY